MFDDQTSTYPEIPVSGVTQNHSLPNKTNRVRSTFRVTVSSGPDNQLKDTREVTATTYKQAANEAAKQMYGIGAYATRATGFEDMCGYFQSYSYVGTRSKAVGKAFWITRVYDTESTIQLVKAANVA